MLRIGVEGIVHDRATRSVIATGLAGFVVMVFVIGCAPRADDTRSLPVHASSFHPRLRLEIWGNAPEEPIHVVRDERHALVLLRGRRFAIDDGRVREADAAAIPGFVMAYPAEGRWLYITPDGTLLESEDALAPLRVVAMPPIEGGLAEHVPVDGRFVVLLRSDPSDLAGTLYDVTRGTFTRLAPAYEGIVDVVFEASRLVEIMLVGGAHFVSSDDGRTFTRTGGPMPVGSFARGGVCRAPGVCYASDLDERDRTPRLLGMSVGRRLGGRYFGRSLPAHVVRPARCAGIIPWGEGFYATCWAEPSFHGWSDGTSPFVPIRLRAALPVLGADGSAALREACDDEDRRDEICLHASAAFDAPIALAAPDAWRVLASSRTLVVYETSDGVRAVGPSGPLALPIAAPPSDVFLTNEGHVVIVERDGAPRAIHVGAPGRPFVRRTLPEGTLWYWHAPRGFGLAARAGGALEATLDEGESFAVVDDLGEARVDTRRSECDVSGCRLFTHDGAMRTIAGRDGPDARLASRFGGSGLPAPDDMPENERFSEEACTSRQHVTWRHGGERARDYTDIDVPSGATVVTLREWTDNAFALHWSGRDARGEFAMRTREADGEMHGGYRVVVGDVSRERALVFIDGVLHRALPGQPIERVPVRSMDVDRRNSTDACTSMTNASGTVIACRAFARTHAYLFDGHDAPRAELELEVELVGVADIGGDLRVVTAQPTEHTLRRELYVVDWDGIPTRFGPLRAHTTMTRCTSAFSGAEMRVAVGTVAGGASTLQCGAATVRVRRDGEACIEEAVLPGYTGVLTVGADGRFVGARETEGARVPASYDETP